jgi:histidine ammonia-lyase
VNDVVLDGTSLTLQELVDVARDRRRVRVGDAASRQVRRCRAVVELLLRHDAKVYGLTTGFGKLRNVVIEQRDSVRLQENLLRSHAAGVGQPFPEDVVRGAILLRANTLCRGNSGVRLAVIQACIDLLNDDVYPYIPQQGSVGASGDLAPLSHLGLVLMGDPHGRVFGGVGDRTGAPVVTHPRDEDFEGLPENLGAAARDAGWRFRPLVLQAKEGLGINNGTQFMTALGALICHDTERTLRLTELSAAMSLEANRGIRGAFDPRIHRARPQSHQEACATRIIGYCDQSEILDLYLNSARLGRARHHLAEARRFLAHAARQAAVQGVRLNALEQVQASAVALEQRIDALIPLGDGRIEQWSALPPTEQIPLLQRRTRPVRQAIGELLQTVTRSTFYRDAAVAKAETELLRAQSQLALAVPDAPIVQDDYSFRCFPQVLACAYRALKHVSEVVRVEANSATDNPLLFPPEPPDGFESMSPAAYAEWLEQDPDACQACVIGGGNFHGEPVAIAMDYLAIAVAEVGNITERRIAHLVDDNHSRGLPPFLVGKSGLNSGLMIPQYTAASLVSENKVLCHPASVDSVPTCGNTEDHVSMGTIAARKCANVLENVRQILAIELLCASQGLSFRAPLRPGRPLREAVQVIRGAGVTIVEEDRVIYPDMRTLRALQDAPELLACVGNGPQDR